MFHHNLKTWKEEVGSKIFIRPKVFSVILFPRLELDLVYLHRDIFLQLRFFTFVVPACVLLLLLRPPKADEGICILFFTVS